MMRRLLSILCVIGGAALFLYPTVNDRYDTYRQQAIMKEWQEDLSHIDQAEEDAPPSPSGSQPPPSSAAVAAPIEPSPAAGEGSTQAVEGVLIIDKIKLRLPILTGATAAHLKVSVASIEHTGRVGEVGNYAIAGHRNQAYGKNFNRLDEVEAGDWIGVDTGTKQYWYLVREKRYVTPDQVQVLQGNGKDKEITLVTCHPMNNPTHRIVVKGMLTEGKD